MRTFVLALALLHTAFSASDLHIAANKADAAEVLKQLRQHPNVIDPRDKDGHTPLHLAVLAGSDEIAGILLQRGANVMAQNNDGETSLHHAAQFGLAKVARVLLEQGASVTEGQLKVMCATGDSASTDQLEVLMEVMFSAAADTSTFSAKYGACRDAALGATSNGRTVKLLEEFSSLAKDQKAEL